MKKTILLTGATDGIGLATAHMLADQGHTLLLHGRSLAKLEQIQKTLSATTHAGECETYVADLSSMTDVEAMATLVTQKHNSLDVLINNAGVYHVNSNTTSEGLDTRFAVNTIAPYLLTKRLSPLLKSGRVINLSSAAQASFRTEELTTPSPMPDGQVYAQSKLALTMWSTAMAQTLKGQQTSVVSVNPKSMLGSKMVKEAYGVNGANLNIGADILCRAALSEEFANASGKYFDNDIGRFAAPHPDALQTDKCQRVIDTIETVLSRLKK